jgi:hypothetical protein
MFTNLDQNHIRAAVKWLLDLTIASCPRRTGKNLINVEKTTPYSVNWGRGMAEENQTTLTHQNIMDIVDIDLSFAYTTVGKDVFKQNYGCPIGGNLSSVYANLKCAFDEALACANNPNFSKNIFAIRQMDDLVGWIRYHNYKSSHDVAQFYKNAILTTNSIYKGGLILEEQPIQLTSKSFKHKFAGTNIIGTYDLSTLFCIHRNKNWDNLVSNRKQKVLCFPHADSKISPRVKLGVQIGTLTRLKAQCTFSYHTIPSVLQNCVEMSTLGYSHNFLNQVLNRLSKKSKEWEQLTAAIKSLLNLMYGPGKMPPPFSHPSLELVENMVALNSLLPSQP